MAINFKTIRRLFGVTRRESATKTPVPRPAIPDAGGYTWLTPGGNSMAVATVYRCANLLADSVANLPLQYLRLKSGVFVPDDRSALNYLLCVQPDSYMSAVDFWRQVILYLLLRGNAYIVPVRDYATGDYMRLALVDTHCVSHDTLRDVYTVNDTASGVAGVYREDEIIHIKNYTDNGKRGISVISYARTAIAVTKTGDEETLSRFENGGAVRGIVGNDGSMSRGFGEVQDDQLKKAAMDIDMEFSSGRKIVSVPGSVHFTPITLTSADLQFLETRKFSVREICRFFGVHPSFVFDDTSNNYKSAETANAAFLSNTLNPILRKIEIEFQRKLVSRDRCSTHRFKFDRSSLFECDPMTRVAYQEKRLANGLVTVNELRREDNMPAVPGGDKVLVSANLKSIEELTLNQENDGQE